MRETSRNVEEVICLFSLCFADEDRLLLGALRNNQLMIWDCAEGCLGDSADWTEDDGGHLFTHIAAL